MADRPPLLHVGYHKTGSSLLQSTFFGAPDGPFALPDQPRHHLVETFVVPEPFSFRAEAAMTQYARFFRDATTQDLCPVLSHERFSGYPPTGGFDAPLILNRLHTCFPDAKVLIVVREQLASIRSMYSQYITDGGALSFADFITRPDPSFRRVPVFSEDFYKYHLMVQAYQDRFGTDNVLVLPHEMLRETPSLFADRICTFAGVRRIALPEIEVNTSRTPVMQSAQRLVNRLLGDTELSRQPVLRIPRVTRGFARTRPLFERLGPKPLNTWLDHRLSKRVAQRFDGVFAASNRALAELTGLDLHGYGYQLTPTPDTDRARSPAVSLA